MKILIISVILVVVLVIGYFIVEKYSSPNGLSNKPAGISSRVLEALKLPDTCPDSSNWSVYTTVGEEFSFKFPSSWVFKKGSNKANVIDIILYEKDTTPDLDKPGNIHIIRGSNKSSASQTIAKFYESSSKAIGDGISVAELVNVNGRKSLHRVEEPDKEIYPDNPENYFVDTLIPSSTDEYVVIVGGLAPKSKAQLNEFSRAYLGVLCTIQFSK